MWVGLLVACGGSWGGEAPVPGVMVLVQDEASALLATLTAAADGTASAELDDRGCVTFVDPFGLESSKHALLSYAVASGDVVPLRGDATPPPRDVTVTLPALAGADSYDLTPSCAAGYRTVSAAAGGGTVTGHIELGGSADVVDLGVEARDVGGDSLGAFAVRDVSIVSGTITLAGTYAPLVPMTLELDGLPANAVTASVGHSATTPRGPST